ncbi:hypothetical protein [Candidatus Sodalis pierantonius]|uniref:hypothetical protein n=1 Tax=Candidatus Sodalis pierantonii TaxID=1486991 RepID=UPI001F18702A|nr:hypothetical protein [Candidatus Sodalis pierantonius]
MTTLENKLPETLRKSPCIESKGFCSWMCSLFNYLTGTFGEKLRCSQLNITLDSIFNQKNGWKTDSTFEYGGTIQTAWRSKQVGGTKYLVTAPAHDLPDENTVQAQLSGGRSTARTLGEIKDIYSNAYLKVLVPIAQSNTLGCFGPRGHFVLLEVTINDGNIQSAQLHDSKAGLIDAFYDGAEHLTKQLRTHDSLSLSKDFFVTTEHRGEQSLFNGNDCGRYTAYYANKITNEGNLLNANIADARYFFKNYFAK